MEYQWTYLLPFFCDDVVPGAGAFEFFLLRAETTEHVDEALVVADGLVLEILVAWVRLLFEHELVLVVKEKDVGAIYQEYRVV